MKKRFVESTSALLAPLMLSLLLLSLSLSIPAFAQPAPPVNPPSGGGSGTVTHTAGPLTLSAIVAGNGGGDLKTPSATATIDSSGNISTPGKITAGAGTGVAGVLDLPAGTLPGSFPSNSFSLIAPTTIGTSYHWTVPTADANGPLSVTGGAITVGATAYTTRPCEIVIGSVGTGSVALADDNDAPVECGNVYGSTLTVTKVECYADAGTPTVTPIITGGSGTSILTGALTCGTGSFATGTLNGTPTQTSNQTIDGNITAAGGTAKYIVIRITRTL